MARYKDITGKIFGSLTAIRLSHITEAKLAYWAFKCKCGKEHVTRANSVAYVSKKGDPEIPSCGCVELARKTKHGFRKAKDTHPLYKIYRGIKNRCYNPESPGYHWYGAKGVTISEEWLDNPEAFIEWGLQNGWKPGLHIDKDTLCKAKGITPHVYSPESCQWVTPKVNVGFATNRENYGKHPNVKLSQETVNEIIEKYFSGKETNQSELARQYGLKSSSSINRLIKLAREAD